MKNSIPQSPIWVYMSAVLLPLNGGYINAATLISFLHNPVGYVTGNLSYSGTYFAAQNYLVFWRMIMLVFSFFIGAVISGLIIKSEQYNKDYRYKINILLQLVLVITSIILLYNRISYCEYLLAATMGLQNAMTTHYGSALIRTTHMTGTTTDLGVLIAHWIKRKNIAFWKLRLYLILIISFFAGTLSGAIAFTHLGALSLCFSVIIYLLLIIVSNK
ncbi:MULTISPECIES: YoaK family protein [Cysteiniphilum]|uniref:Membrane protein n=1 Tax=Cysteiniphilum litorale TaxID=2056700 RepID=A0A8J2Z707_9GAMM|nr:MULTISPECIES: YoaK family protein [Cysteiniphilum]GGG07955.1 membrane protein [Cysteiniphilum litorale]